MEPCYLGPANTDAGLALIEDKEAEAAHLSFSYYRRAGVEIVLADTACDALELTVSQRTKERHALESLDRRHRASLTRAESTLPCMRTSVRVLAGLALHALPPSPRSRQRHGSALGRLRARARRSGGGARALPAPP